MRVMVEDWVSARPGGKLGPTKPLLIYFTISCYHLLLHIYTHTQFKKRNKVTVTLNLLDSNMQHSLWFAISSSSWGHENAGQGFPNSRDCLWSMEFVSLDCTEKASNSQNFPSTAANSSPSLLNWIKVPSACLNTEHVFMFLVFYAHLIKAD